MFERFTHDARDTVVRAQKVARELDHHEIVGQHLLLSMVDGDGVATRIIHDLGIRRRDVVDDLRHFGPSDEQALRHIGVDLAAVRRRVEETFGPGSLDAQESRGTGRRRRRLLGSHLPFNAEAKKALEQALREAQSLSHSYLGTEHILLALLARTAGPVPGTLRRIGLTVDYDVVRARVIAELARTR